MAYRMKMNAPKRGLPLKSAFRAMPELTVVVGKGLKGLGKWK